MKKKITLTKEQIEIIEDYLTDKDVKYIDIRFEILDHLISNVEFLIEYRNISFKNAFDDVKLKWNKSLKSTSSFWLGLAHHGPSIFIDKCLRIYKPFLFKSILLTIVLICVIYGLKESFGFSLIPYKENITLFISVSQTIYIVFAIYGYVRMKIKKINSTFSFLYYKQMFPNLFLAIIYHPLVNNSYFTNGNDFGYPWLVLLFIFFTTALGGRYLFKKHLEAISRHKSIFN